MNARKITAVAASTMAAASLGACSLPDHAAPKPVASTVQTAADNAGVYIPNAGDKTYWDGRAQNLPDSALYPLADAWEGNVSTNARMDMASTCHAIYHGATEDDITAQIEHIRNENSVKQALFDSGAMTFDWHEFYVISLIRIGCPELTGQAQGK